MLIDIPYKEIMDNGRKYDVWLLRDIYENTFTDIAKEYSVTVSCIIGDYKKLLLLKLQYYVNHLSIVHGYGDTKYFETIWHDALECYLDRKCVVAYFEKEYSDILTEYRNGEPGMPEQFLQALPPLRTEFSKRTVSSIVRLRDINEMSFAAIGKRLRMTKQQAERLYDCHYSILCSRMLGEIVKITGDSGICGRYLWVYNIKKGKKGYDCLVNEYPEICKDLIKPQNGVNKVKGYRFGHL